MTMHPLFQPLYIDFCAFFNGNHDYFECHEVLEEYWKETAPSERNHPLVGYILLATSMYHWRRDNFNGALRTMKKAIQVIETSDNELFFEKIDRKQLISCMHASKVNMENGHPFAPFQIAIVDEKLQQMVEQRIHYLPNESESFLRDKHKLRDRSAIIEERRKQLAIKNT